MQTFNNKYFKVPLLYSGGGGFKKCWQQVSYISNDNLTYTNVSLRPGESLELEVAKIEDIDNNGELLGEYAYVSAYYGDLRITDAGELALHSNNATQIFTTPKNEIVKIKYLRNDSRHCRVVLNDDETKTVDTGYNQSGGKSIGIFHSNHLGNVSNFNIYKLNYLGNIYVPAICIKAYDDIVLDTVAFVDFENELVIKAVSGNFVAHE